MGLRLVTGLVLAALVVGSCAAGASPSPIPGGPLPREGRTFLSTSVTESGTNRPLVAGTRIRIGFQQDRLGVSAGCNTMGARYQVVGGSLRLSDAAVTEMGCDPARQAQDEWLFGLLGSSPTIALEGDRMTLRAGQTVIELLDRKIAEPDLPLRGRTWTLESIISADTVSSVPFGVVATLEFSDDGRVSVSTGCNTGGGRVTVGQGTLEISDVAITKRACPGAAGGLEAAVLEVLRASSISYQIEGSQLRLRTGDRGLDFRA